MTQTFAESLVDLLNGAHAPDSALGRLQAAVTPMITTGSDGDAVLAFTISSLVADMEAHQQEFVEAVEKAYGVPWSRQFQKIKQDALDAWAEALRSWDQPAQRVAVLATIVRTGRNYTRIEPRIDID